jgi:hypothetical protein
MRRRVPVDLVVKRPFVKLQRHSLDLLGVFLIILDRKGGHGMRGIWISNL